MGPSIRVGRMYSDMGTERCVTATKYDIDVAMQRPAFPLFTGLLDAFPDQNRRVLIVGCFSDITALRRCLNASPILKVALPNDAPPPSPRRVRHVQYSPLSLISSLQIISFRVRVMIVVQKPATSFLMSSTSLSVDVSSRASLNSITSVVI
ncbi:hypothetical protein H4582DRAFT_1968524 [Lactarius indigo]|nr:hypothetical protein H4582DRAFT_1968524 [Lactarius indigo]